MTDTIHKIGYYCGRIHDGFWGEPQNSLSNLAFVAAAGVGLWAWQARRSRDPWQLLLIGLAALIGVGSFIFHSLPNPMTLQMDLIPIQLFGLAAFFYLFRREFRLSALHSALLIGGFFVLRQGFLLVVPRGALGGGISHVPTLLLLLGCGLGLTAARRKLGHYLLVASAFYVGALAARSIDVPLCERFPFGVHWAWHFLTAAVAGTVLLGIVRTGAVEEGAAAGRPA